ncbi:pilus (MSHA type) biogenesis protein MshL [Bermanella sp. R86510]|uniref:pilus (MSHA type) biogenesis protein MshL n=1 Tax=unclassified Bermanella TaxID=2627862 RepID=UPI0037CCB67A
MRRLLYITIITILLSSCSSLDRQSYPVSENVLSNLESEIHADEIVLEDEPKSPDPVLNQERFDVVANGSAADVFFESLVNDTNINIVVHPDIKHTISLRLKNVTLEETLQAVRDHYGLQYRATPYGYQILPKDLQNQVFHVNYLNVARQGSSGLSVASGQISSADIDGSGRENSQSGVSTASRIDTQANTDFWKSLSQSVSMLVGSGDGRRVIVDGQAGLVVVRAYPNELASVADFLKKAEYSLQKQVVIEAKILEVQLNDGFQSGIEWDGIASSGSTNFTPSLNSQRVSNAGDSAGIFSVAFSGSDFSGVIQMLKTQGKVQVLSSPRISTVNNQKAIIKVGTDEFFVTDVSTNTTTTTTTTNTSPEVTLTPFFSGIALDVTPQIGRNNDVILHVHPSVTEVVERNKIIELGEETFDLPLAFSSIRETDSIIRAKNGQVVAIGGLLQDRQTRSDSSIPWLSKIPIFGMLFRQTNQETVKSELVILLQPKVLTDDNQEDKIRDLKNTFPYWKR